MFCHRKAMGLGGKSIAFLPHFSPFFGEKNCDFQAQKICLDFQRAKPQRFAKFREISKFGSHSAVGEENREEMAFVKIKV